MTTGATTKACYGAIGRAGGKYVALDAYAGYAATRKTVFGDWVLAPTLSGHGCTWPAPYGRPRDEKLKEIGIKFYELAQTLLDQGKLRNHPMRILQGGLEAVPEGLDLLSSGTISAEKVVIKL